MAYESRLFYVSEKVTGCRYLADIEAENSAVTAACLNRSRMLLYYLQAVNSTRIPVYKERLLPCRTF